MVFVDWENPNLIKEGMLYLVYAAIVLVLIIIGLVIYAAHKILIDIFKSTLKRPLGVILLIILGTMYFTATFAPFFGTTPFDKQNSKAAYHKPTALVFNNGSLEIQRYENVNPNIADYQAIKGETIPIKWFASGEPYTFLGMSFSTRLIQADYTKLAERMGVESIDEQLYPFYLLGSDHLGRDIWTRLLYGARISLSVGMIGIAITMSIGFLVGGLSGYFGGRFDFWMMRFVELIMTLPSLYLFAGA